MEQKMHDGCMKEFLTVRNAVGAVLLGLFFKVAGGSFGGGIDALGGNLGRALGAMILLILSGCFFSSTLCDILSRPFTRFIDTIYFGNDDRELPPVNLKLTGIYRAELRFEEALAECERQLEYHPRSPELWREMICTAGEAGDRDLVQQLQRRAFRKLKGRDRMLLEREFSRL
jgi:hypothetical protein